MAREIDATQALEDELVAALAKDTGMLPSLAVMFVRPVVRYLQSKHAGRRMYVPSPGRTYDVEAMRQQLAETRDVDLVCKTHGVSRTTLYRLLDESEETPNTA